MLAAALLATHTAHASIEQFASFDVFAPEIDDESAFDYFLSRPLDDWRAEWESSHSALRADQGCMTAGIWYQDNEFKTRSDMGKRAWLDVGFLQHTDPAGSWQSLQFDVLRSTRWGAFGGRFKPSYEKSQQDFAALWELGDGRSAWQARATFTIEDTFNKLWTFRQASVGENHWEPYRVHPFEPALDVTWRGPHHRLQLADTWLTPSRQDIVDADPAIAGTRTLQGNHALFLAERDLGRWTGIARWECTSARSGRTSPALIGDGRVDRQRWIAEATVRRALGPRWRAEAGYFYERRAQDWRPPIASGTFGALDRVGHAEVAWQPREGWQLRTGLLYDRAGVARTWVQPGFYGSRKESRAYIGMQARLGRVRIQAIEGIELDTEPYPVSFHHDKGFLHLQTTF